MDTPRPTAMRWVTPAVSPDPVATVLVSVGVEQSVPRLRAHAATSRTASSLVINSSAESLLSAPYHGSVTAAAPNVPRAHTFKTARHVKIRLVSVRVESAGTLRNCQKHEDLYLIAADPYVSRWAFAIALWQRERLTGSAIWRARRMEVSYICQGHQRIILLDFRLSLSIVLRVGGVLCRQLPPV